jgi:signal transduction histidine kinase
MKPNKNSLLFKIVFFNDIVIVFTAIIISSILTFIIFENMDKELKNETESVLKMMMSSYDFFGKMLEDDSMKIGNGIEVERAMKDRMVNYGKTPEKTSKTGLYTYLYKDLKVEENSIYYYKFARELKKQLYATNSMEDQTRIVSLVDNNGVVLAEDYGNILNKPYSIEKSKLFIDKILRKGELFSDPKFRMYSMEYIAESEKLIMRSGSVVGYSKIIRQDPGIMCVSWVVDRNFLEELERSLKFKKGTKIFILNGEGKYYIGRFDNQDSQEKLFDEKIYEELKSKTAEYKIVKKNINGEGFYIGYFPTYDVNGNVSAIIGVAQSLKDISGIKLKSFIMIGIGAMIIIVLSSIIFGIMLYRVIKPLIEMAEMADSFSKLGYSSNSFQIKGIGEIEVLSKSFADMIEKITESNLKLKDKNEIMKESINKLKIIEKLIFSIYSEDDKDKVCYYALSAITSEIGLGYSRAIYFEYNSEKNVLEGKFASSNLNLIDNIEDSREARRKNFETFLRDIKGKENFENEALDHVIKLIKIPATELNIIGKAFIQNKNISIDEIPPDRAGDNFIMTLDLKYVAIIPVMYKEAKYGCIVVDNCMKEDEMNEHDVEILSVVAMNVAIYLRNKQFEREKIRTEKLSTIGKVTSSIVHEIRAPLTSIKGFADMLLKTYKEEIKIQKYLGIINSEVDRLNNLASLLLDYSGNKNYNYEKIKINDIIAETVEFFEHELKIRDITLSTLVHEEIYISADRYKLKQVMVNLIKNAIEAKDKSFSKLNISLQKFSLYGEVKIWDNGKGLEKEELERLFEPFNSSKLNGTGLGLAIVKDILTNHKGTIEFNSEAGNWTEITIKLPIYKEE